MYYNESIFLKNIEILNEIMFKTMQVLWAQPQRKLVFQYSNYINYTTEDQALSKNLPHLFPSPKIVKY